MGYMRHHAIIVTASNRDKLSLAHMLARELFGKRDMWDNELAPVSEIMESGTNSYVSFMVAPDGSKEGWGTSDRGDAAREEFVTWLDKQRHEDLSSSYDWVEVQYGDENKETKIVNDSDAAARAATSS